MSPSIDPQHLARYRKVAQYTEDSKMLEILNSLEELLKRMTAGEASTANVLSAQDHILMIQETMLTEGFKQSERVIASIEEARAQTQ